MNIEREAMAFDVLFVGGGPANLAGAIRLMQLAKEKGVELEVALIEKGAEIGSHSISGAVLNPRALEELLPDHQAQGCPIENVVRGDAFWLLTNQKAITLPMTPKQMHNTGNYIVSLSRFTRWLGEFAEAEGVNIFPGFAGVEVLLGEDEKTIIGVRTDDKGLDHDGNPKNTFEPGIDLMAKVTVFGEGARGSLMRQIETKLDITAGKMPQVYETGVKEVIQLPEENYFTSNPANDIHTLGYPLGTGVPGGGFIYQMADNKISIGYLVALCYEDPQLHPYEAFIQFKRHPVIAEIIKGGKVVEQGARTVTTGGYYTMPTLAVDGAVFTGGAAGFQNTPALKGIHLGMKSGMLAAEAIVEALISDNTDAASLGLYQALFEDSWAKKEIFEGRNFAQALAMKGPMKWIHLGAQYITGGRGLVDPLPLRADHETLKPLKNGAAPPIDPPDPAAYDGELIVDRLTGVYLARTNHREDEPCHLVIQDPAICVEKCYPTFGCPCTHFCPAKVYELDIEGERPRLKVNAANCLHCKTCDIKDPYENILWQCPEGGEGPGYQLA
jgi:electron-transferring-flavoprotein dehydrogenase